LSPTLAILIILSHFYALAKLGKYRARGLLKTYNDYRSKTHLFETQSSIAQVNPQTKSCARHYHTYATIEIIN